MRLLIIIVAAIVIAGAFLYWQPELHRDWFGGTPLAPSTKTTVYKWRDESGAWQITDRPPASGIAYERLEYHSDTNAMPLTPRDE